MFPLIFGHTFNDKEELEVEMKKIFLIIGRSGSGKDTVFRALKDRIKEKDLDINEVPIYTTRPMRPGEAEGEEYQFISEREFLKMEEAHEFVESRSYQTVFGIWRYGTAKKESNLKKSNYILIGTLETFYALEKEYGESIYPIYIEVNEERLRERTIKRGGTHSEKEYMEMYRRFLADRIDYAEEKLAKIHQLRRISNNGPVENCINEIWSYIQCSCCMCDTCALDSDECEDELPCLCCSNGSRFTNFCNQYESEENV